MLAYMFCAEYFFFLQYVCPAQLAPLLGSYDTHGMKMLVKIHSLQPHDTHISYLAYNTSASQVLADLRSFLF